MSCFYLLSSYALSGKEAWEDKYIYIGNYVIILLWPMPFS